jgi:uncharacterized protein YqgC (DUF456 family)
MFFSLPALIPGSVLGAVAAEKFGAKRADDEALRAGVGAGLGFVVATVARLACALAMIGVFLFAVWPRYPRHLKNRSPSAARSSPRSDRQRVSRA